MEPASKQFLHELLSLNPRVERKIMLAGHCDKIGFLVKYISPQGFVYLDKVAGSDYGVTLGEHRVVHTKHGRVKGIVGRKPLHMQQGSETQQIPAESKIWLDIGAPNEEQARKLVDIGDYITFKLNVMELGDDLLVATRLDNKAGPLARATRMQAQRNMHTQVEMVSISDIDNSIKLLVEFIRSVTEQTDFRPINFQQ